MHLACYFFGVGVEIPCVRFGDVRGEWKFHSHHLQDLVGELKFMAFRVQIVELCLPRVRQPWGRI